MIGGRKREREEEGGRDGEREGGRESDCKESLKILRLAVLPTL